MQGSMRAHGRISSDRPRLWVTVSTQDPLDERLAFCLEVEAMIGTVGAEVENVALALALIQVALATAVEVKALTLTVRLIFWDGLMLDWSALRARSHA